MSRVGKKPIPIPSGVKIQIEEGAVRVEGPKGKLALAQNPAIAVAVEAGQVVCRRGSEERQARALHGLTRSLVANMIQGVTDGFAKRLDLVGVGYRAAIQGRNLTLTLGYSHPIVFPMPPGISIEVKDQTQITINGADKQQVGAVAATIRRFRPPEPYKGKGVLYAGEVVRRKAGKAGAK
jgi:large subunit ribosomal protein L6